MTKQIEVLDPVLAAVETEEIQIARQNGVDPSIIVMSTGVKFRIKAVSKHALAGIAERYTKTKPKPPVVTIESKGRKEENPDDPDYKDAYQSWELSLAMAINNFLLLRGIDLVDGSIPDDMVLPDSEDWQYEAELLGANSDSKRACYLEWIKVVAAPKDDVMHDGKLLEMGDISKMLNAIGRKSGINQGDVDTAVSQFRR